MLSRRCPELRHSAVSAGIPDAILTEAALRRQA
jgi:hypothetical protein